MNRHFPHLPHFKDFFVFTCLLRGINALMSKRAIIGRISECRQMINHTENKACRLDFGLITSMHLVLASVLMHHNSLVVQHCKGLQLQWSPSYKLVPNWFVYSRKSLFVLLKISEWTSYCIMQIIQRRLRERHLSQKSICYWFSRGWRSILWGIGKNVQFPAIKREKKGKQWILKLGPMAVLDMNGFGTNEAKEPFCIVLTY